VNFSIGTDESAPARASNRSTQEEGDESDDREG
jgi:hypothetical protein